jgi:hypothetical protein
MSTNSLRDTAALYVDNRYAEHAYAPAPQRRPQPRPRTRPRLRAVPTAAPQPPLVRLVAMLATISVIGLLGVLYLHTLTAKGAYALHDAQRSDAQLHAQEESLAHQVDALNNPASIANKAASLGMRPSGSPIFLMPNGKTLGAKLPKGTKLTVPVTTPADGLVVAGKPTPTASPTTSASSNPQTSNAKGSQASTTPTPQTSSAPAK